MYVIHPKKYAKYLRSGLVYSGRKVGTQASLLVCLCLSVRYIFIIFTLFVLCTLSQFTTNDKDEVVTTRSTASNFLVQL